MQKTIEDFQSTEKRISSRLKVHYLTDITLQNEIIYSTVIDISESGIGIMTPHKLYLDEVLSLRINCNMADNDRVHPGKKDIDLTAKVIWVSDVQEKNMYRTGLEIMDISKDSLKMLQEHMAALIRRAFEQA